MNQILALLLTIPVVVGCNSPRAVSQAAPAPLPPALSPKKQQIRQASISNYLARPTVAPEVVTPAATVVDTNGPLGQPFAYGDILFVPALQKASTELEADWGFEPPSFPNVWARLGCVSQDTEWTFQFPVSFTNAYLRGILVPCAPITEFANRPEQKWKLGSTKQVTQDIRDKQGRVTGHRVWTLAEVKGVTIGMPGASLWKVLKKVQ
jgi:hypothetical protein